jgi:hypothetical protein
MVVAGFRWMGIGRLVWWHHCGGVQTCGKVAGEAEHGVGYTRNEDRSIINS